MAALSENRQTGRMENPSVVLAEVAASAHIFQGSLVCVKADGYATPAADTALYVLGGVAREEVDNSGGGDGALEGKLYTNGWYPFVASGAAQAWVGKPLYVVDDQTVALASTNAVFAGTCRRVESATSVIIDIAPATASQASGEWPDGTAAAPGKYFQSDEDLGVARLGANEAALCAGGAAILTWDAAGFNGILGENVPADATFTTATFGGQVDFAAGAVGAPTICVTGSLTSGIFQSAADELAVSIAGVQVTRWDGTGIICTGINGPIGTVTPADGTFVNVDVGGTFNFGQDPADLIGGFKEISDYITGTLDGFDHGSDAHLAVVWDITQVVGAGTNTVTVRDGWNELVTGGGGGPDMESTRSNGLHVYAADAPRIEAVVELAAVAAGQTFFFGFWAAATRYVEIIHEPATSVNWLLRIDDTGGAETIDSGVEALITTPTKLAIAIDAAGAPTWAIDDVVQDVAAITNVMANAHYVEWRILDVAAAPHTAAVRYVLLEYLKQQ